MIFIFASEIFFFLQQRGGNWKLRSTLFFRPLLGSYHCCSIKIMADEFDTLCPQIDALLVQYYECFAQFQTAHSDLSNHLKNVPPPNLPSTTFLFCFVLMIFFFFFFFLGGVEIFSSEAQKNRRPKCN